MPPPQTTASATDGRTVDRGNEHPTTCRNDSHNDHTSSARRAAIDEDVDELEDEDEDHGHEPETPREFDSARVSAVNGPRDSDILLSSTLHNPSDALKLLATASSWRSIQPKRSDSSTNVVDSPQDSDKAGMAEGTPGSSAATESRGWGSWQPIVSGLLTQAEAEYLFKYFETNISPLYPLLAPEIFSDSHLPTLTSSESLLLSAMVAIASRYNDKLDRSRADAIHVSIANFIRQELVYLQEGSPVSRNIGSVDALLLLTEWPSIPLDHLMRTAETTTEGGNEEAAELLKTSAQYDSMSWTYIGIAVRLAQELGLDNVASYRLNATNDRDSADIGLGERALRTWIFAYNADRHVSVRLGRNAVVQAYMSSAWWEKVTQRASNDVLKQGLKELWAERTLPQGLLAALMGTIQERLYPNKDITRSLIRTGQWENFVRSLDHELRNMQSKTQGILKQASVQSTLLQIEIDYVRLYGNAIALRALQERLRRRVKANDLLFVRPSLLNLQEGPWIIDSLAAAQSILLQTVSFLWPKGYLRVCPARIFQRVLFAATFLLKALAVGVIEHSQNKTMDLLDQAVSALHFACVDSPHHISRGFSALLSRLHAHCKPALLEQSGSIDPAGGTTTTSSATTARSFATTAGGAEPLHHGAQAHHTSAVPSVPHSYQSYPHTTNPLPLPSIPHVYSLTQNSGLTHNDPNAQPPTTTATANSGTSTAAPPDQPANLADAFSIAAAQAAKEHKMPVPLDPSTATWQPDMFGFELPFELDPTAGQSAVNREQDALFHSLYQTGDGGVLQSTAAGSALLNVFGTLMGDAEFEF
ncbi:zinc finger transcriptional activator [Microbotryomycetes sp. JL201]|nr:zinc finger transcriptional activator [Microbotryomycetes sp. JL201]